MGYMALVAVFIIPLAALSILFFKMEVIKSNKDLN